MAIVRPFKAIRPEKEYAGRVVSLPYDVMNREEAKEMAKDNPYSFLHICRAEIDLDVEDPYCDKVYVKAKENIETFLEKGVFIEDEKKTFYKHGIRFSRFAFDRKGADGKAHNMVYFSPYDI